jgi:hypothetical protein
MNIPSVPKNPLSQFGLNLQSIITSCMEHVDQDLSKDDETKEDFYKNVQIIASFTFLKRMFYVLCFVF